MHVNRYVQTMFFPRAIAEAGKRAGDLKPYELGLFDQDTNLTVDAATWAPDKSYVFKWKSPSVGMNNPQFGDIRGTELPLESLPVSRIDYSDAFDQASMVGKPYVYYWGWDGISDCKTISLECHKDYGLQITVRGEYVRDTFGQNLTEIVPFTTGCCEDCQEKEIGSTTIDKILEAIEKSTFYIDNYFTAEKVESCCPATAPFTKVDFKKWRIDVTDTGDSKALADLQAQYPDYDIAVYARKGVTTTYEICIQDGVTPVDYTQTRLGVLKCDDCPNCPTAFTKIDGGSKYIAVFSEPALTDATDAFKLVNYANATTGQAAIDGLVEAHGALVTNYVANSAKLLTVGDDTVTLEVLVTAGSNPEQTLTEGITLTYIGETSAQCVGSATFSWAECETVYKITRTVCTQFKKEDCTLADSVYLARVQEAIAGSPDIIDGTLAVRDSNDCVISFQVDQYNNACLEDGCDTYGKDGAKFDHISPYMGHTWDTCDCEGWTVDGSGCPVPPTVSTDDTCRVGVKFTGALISQECLPAAATDIRDDIPREPIQIEVTLIEQYNEEECDTLDIPFYEAQTGTMANGLGQYAKRYEVLSRIYDTWIYFSPKEELGSLMQHRTGYEYSSDKCDGYHYIYLRHNSGRNNNYYQGPQGANREEILIAVEKDNVPLFESIKSFLNGTLLSHGKKKLL